MMRTSYIERKTSETSVMVELNLDGKGEYDIKTSIPFLDHMLTLMCRHGIMDMRVRAEGDIEIDYHHLMEDIGISLGKGLREALKDKGGIERFGVAKVPMDEALAEVIIDISGRPFLVYQVDSSYEYIKDLQVALFEDFFRAFSVHAMINLHIIVHYGRDTHHVFEAIFKALGRAILHAVKVNERTSGIPSTKGVID
ncbi:MAG: imidazoleglycerol-phosphate dehydratase HisB [Candidatus Magnetoovum sp. WYHC-5]|nr:imidazoleglycerol-phosphate dehydratase HisB [Candidatus Magnetoovum sp. WYHC-5]